MVCVLQVPCILGVDLTAADLEEFIHQLADTHGASAPPPAVVRVLNYKSCRGAIMFGDGLLPAECRQLIHQLKQTSLCFQVSWQKCLKAMSVPMFCNTKSLF
jgi:DNA mismatch repair protein MLH3